MVGGRSKRARVVLFTVVYATFVLVVYAWTKHQDGRVALNTILAIAGFPVFVGLVSSIARGD